MALLVSCATTKSRPSSANSRTGATEGKPSSAEGDKPNILFIMVDDLGKEWISACGAELIKTPNIDALAKGGMRFTNAYAAAPTCSPTRSSILTGKYPARNKLTNWIGALMGVHAVRNLPLSEITE